MMDAEFMAGRVGRRGLMLVLSSPSGAGKSSIARHLLAEDDNLTLSVSATTRPPRPNEVDGSDYHFVDQDRFDAMVADNAFLEYAQVFGNSYGTPKADVMAVLERGGDVLFDIDWQGAQQVANAAVDDLVTVFVLAAIAGHPSCAARIACSGQRRSGRLTHGQRHPTKSAITGNMTILSSMMISNVAVGSVRSILAAERLRRDRQSGLTAFVRDLQSEGDKPFSSIARASTQNASISSS